MKSNKIPKVIISIVLILIIISAVLAYLFIATDVFKSSQELFAKYFAQNSDAFQKIIDLKTVNAYKKLENENRYESSTNITMLNSEGGEVSNPINNLAIKLDIRKDDEEQYMYADGQILYKDEEYLEAELIKEQEMYGIRFSDVVKKFITVKNDENIDAVAKDLDIDVKQIQTLINMLDKSEQEMSNEEFCDIKDKYLNIITSSISNGTFGKQKNAMITYNNVTTETNAYSVTLSSEQVEDMLIEILNNVKLETEILDKLQTIVNQEVIVNLIDETIKKINEEIILPTIKITVFEQKQKTIRTDIEIGGYKVSIENTEQNEEVKTKISYSDLNNDQVIQLDSEISKKNTENQENFEIIINVVHGEENYKITLSSHMQLSDKGIELDTEISHQKYITITSIVLKNEVSIGNDYEKIQTLDSGKYVLLNEFEEENRKELISLLKERVPQKTSERIDLLKEKLGLKVEKAEDTNSEDGEPEKNDTESNISQVEINKFNAKFEFYTGNEVSAENVRTLLDIVKNNFSGYESLSEILENEETEESKVSIKLYIEKDKANEESMSEILEEINDNKKYKVLIFYKEENGLIDYITITEI